MVVPLRLPQFLGIGAQKAGTTTLHDWLTQHPQIFLPAQKELHYFSLHFDAGLPWYAEHFAAAGPAQRCGEITPYYLFHPQAPQRIRALLPQVRLIVLLRDPVERALSQYFHARRLGLETLPLKQALAAEAERLAGAEWVLRAPGGRHLSHQEHSYLERSRYEQQLARYQALFGAEQLLVRSSTALFSGSEQLWRELLAFLELDAWALPALPRRNAGAAEAAAVEPALRQQLREQLQPTYAAMQACYGISW